MTRDELIAALERATQHTVDLERWFDYWARPADERQVIDGVAHVAKLFGHDGPWFLPVADLAGDQNFTALIDAARSRIPPGWSGEVRWSEYGGTSRVGPEPGHADQHHRERPQRRHGRRRDRALHRRPEGVDDARCRGADEDAGMTHPVPDAALAHIKLGTITRRVPASHVDKAYAAGFFDAGGCIVIAVNKNAMGARGAVYNLRVVVGGVDPSALVWLRRHWAGSITLKSRRTSGGRLVFHWQCFARNAATFLEDVLPHLIIMRSRAKIALAFQAAKFNPGGCGHTTAYRTRLAEFRRRLQALNTHKPVVSREVSHV